MLTRVPRGHAGGPLRDVLEPHPCGYPSSKRRSLPIEREWISTTHRVAQRSEAGRPLSRGGRSSTRPNAAGGDSRRALHRRQLVHDEIAVELERKRAPCTHRDEAGVQIALELVLVDRFHGVVRRAAGHLRAVGFGWTRQI